VGLFGSSGIRAVVDKAFLQLAFEVGLAVGASYRSVVVGCDTRTSGDAVRYAFLSGLLSAGASASYAGVAPTPTIAYAARGFEAGAMITASHNPPEYNGIKLVNPDGSAFDAAQREQIEAAVYSKSAGTAPSERFGQCADRDGVIEEHLARILADFPARLRLKVVVDCGGGAASQVTPPMLTGLGCKVVPLNCEPTGHFPRPVEPTPENLGDLMKAVKSEKADLGIAHDGDADRVAIVDDRGRFVSADKLMVVLARHLRVKKVVTTVDASMVINELGFGVTRTRVGDAFVSDELRRSRKGATAQEFGAESSGCFIFPQVSLCPDGMYAAATIAQIAAQQPLSEIVDRIPSYPLRRGSVAADRASMAEVERLLRKETKADASLETTDGLRLVYPDGWLLIRPSGTEPKIRITAEARSEQRARAIYDFGVSTIESCIAAEDRAKR
jgi:phosphoglucosamine mutase